MSKHQLTPLEQLIDDRKRLRKACLEQEKVLKSDFALVHEHASCIIFSGIVSAISSRFKKKHANPNPATTQQPESTEGLQTSVLTTYIHMAKQLWPTIWEISRPILTTWGIQVARKWFTTKFLTKKK